MLGHVALGREEGGHHVMRAGVPTLWAACTTSIVSGPLVLGGLALPCVGMGGTVTGAERERERELMQ
jgi:hypothetical protein